MDQSFTADNFRTIFDHENRKGHFLEGRFFPDLEQLTFQIKNSTGDIRTLRKAKLSMEPEHYEQEMSALQAVRDTQRAAKEEQLKALLEGVAAQVSRANFRIEITRDDTIGTKPVYIAEKSAASYFAIKQVQININKLYKVKQSNRYNILCQLRTVLSDKMPRYVIRTDINSFYESVPREQILDKINNDSLLTLTSKKFIRQVLYRYGVLSGNDVGIPRGVGLSAYLCEIYMRSFDEHIKSLPHVVFYARYVDDIVIVANKPVLGTALELFSGLKNTFTHFRLQRNHSKTRCFRVDGKKAHNMDFLGYKITFGLGAVDFNMTADKISRYRARVDAVISQYLKREKSNEKEGRKLLLKRFRFLTSNTRLHNNKRNAVVGIYFSNALLTKVNDLIGLDAYYQSRLTQIGNATARAAAAALSFKNGFETKAFSKFSEKELAEIVGAWKNVA